MFEKLKSIRMALCLLALSFLVLCGFVTTRDEKYVSYFLHLYSAGLFREQNFTLHDAKAVFGKDHIHRIEMQLSCYKAMPLESARKLVTNVAVDFLDKINNDPGLKEKGLIKEKFIPRQLYFRIMCDNVVGENYETIYIREIILDKGQLTYITFKNMPEFWGKSYTIHEDFDYALMLVGNTRHPEDVIAETVIVPELRALPGDTSDFPTRQHEELLYTGRQVTQAELEPRESAPSPISPLVIPVEAISQLNLPPQKVEIKEVVTPIEQEKAPPVPPVATQSQAPVVPSEPAVVPQPVLPTAQAPTAPQVIEKSVAPTQEVVVPTAPVPTAPIPAAPVPVAPVATLPASTAPLASAAIVAPTAPTAAVLPTAPAAPTAPEVAPTAPQIPDRLKQSQGEAQKLLTIVDTPPAQKEAVEGEPVQEKEQVPTLPEATHAEIADNSDQIDFFKLFDSFAAQPAQDDEINDDAETAPDLQDNSTPPDESFEMPEYEFNTPPPADRQAPQAIVADNDDAETAPDLKDNSTPPDQNFEMPENEFNAPPAEDKQAPEVIIADNDGYDSDGDEAEDDIDADDEQDDDQVEEVAVVATEEPAKPAEPAEPSWWDRLFKKDETAPATEPTAPQEIAELDVADDEAAQAESEVQPEPEEPKTESSPSWWDRLFKKSEATAKTDDVVAVDTQEQPSETESTALQESTSKEAATQETTAQDESAQNETLEKFWWQRMFSSKKDEAQALATEQHDEVVALEDQNLENQNALEEQNNVVEKAAPEQAGSQSSSWWDRLFSAKKSPNAEVVDESVVAEVAPAPIPDVQPQTPAQQEPTHEDVIQENVQIVEEEAVEPLQSEPSKSPSWWDRMFNSKKEEPTQPQDATEELTLAEEPALEQPVEPTTPKEPSTPSWHDRVFGSDKNEAAPHEVLVVEDEMTQAAAEPETQPTEVQPEDPQTDSQSASSQTSWWDRMFKKSEAQAPAEAPQEVAVVEETAADAETQQTQPIEKSAAPEVVLVEDNMAEADAVAEVQPQEPQTDSQAQTDSQPTSSQTTSSQASWWDRMFKKSEAQVPAEAAQAVAVVEDTQPESQGQPAEEPSPEVMLVEDSIEQTEPLAEAQPEEPKSTGSQASWWDRIFKKDDSKQEQAPAEAQQEVALVEDSMEQAEPVVEAQPEEPKSTGSQASWWDRMFKKNDSKQEQAPAEAQQEVALVEDSMEQAEPVVEAQSEEPKSTGSQASWWDRMFKKDDSKQEQAPAEAQQEVALVEDSMEQAETVVEAQPEEPKSTGSQASWWDRMFKKNDSKQEQAPAEAQPEVALVEDDAEQAAPEIEAQPEDAKASWLDRLFKKDETPASQQAQQVADQEGDQEVQQEANQEANQATQQEVALVEEGQLQESAQEPEEASQKTSWWNRLFTSNDAANEAEQEEAPQQGEQYLESEPHVVVIDESKTNPPPKSSWWEGFFKSREAQPEEEEAVQYDPEPSNELVEETVPETESAEDWWRRIFAEKQAEDAAQEAAEQEAAEIQAAEIQAASAAIAAQAQSDDGDIEQQDGSGPQEERQPIASAADQNDDDGDDEEHDAAYFPNIVSEHSQIDTDEAIGKDEAQSDPVLKSLYSEPLSWMQTRSAVPAAGTWGSDSEEAEANEPVVDIDTEEELIYDETE